MLNLISVLMFAIVFAGTYGWISGVAMLACLIALMFRRTD